VVTRLFRFILTAVRVNIEVLCAGIANLLLLGLLWGFAYELVGQLNPHAFAFASPPGVEQTMTRMNAIYFSFVSLSTVGYGDILPVSGVARMLATMESMTGMLYVAVLISRLVALYSTPPAPTGPPE
jgi:voltage-gated potassium channel Kch